MSAFTTGDRVTMVRSATLPPAMEGHRAIVQAVDGDGTLPMSIHVIYRMDGQTPIVRGTDTLADEYLDPENLRPGWE